MSSQSDVENFIQVKGERGGMCYFNSADEQLYKRKTAHGNTIYFECCRPECLGAIKNVNGVIMFHKKHSVIHADQKNDFLLLLFRQTFSEEAVLDPAKQPHLLFEEVRRRPKFSPVKSMITYYEYDRRVRRQRQAAVPTVPKTVSEFSEAWSNPIVIEFYGTTLEGGSLFMDCIQAEDESLSFVFGSPKVLAFLKDRPANIKADGTFNSHPKLAAVNQPKLQQLFILHADVFNQNIAFLFVLMTRRTQASYTAVLKLLRDKHGIRVKSVMSDFEKGMRNAFVSVFPECQLRGCWFHFGHAIIEHLKNRLKLKQFLDATPEGWHLVRLILALPLLPVDLVSTGLLVVQAKAVAMPQLRPFFEYFEEEWMNTVTPNNFCLHDLTERTNNLSENYNKWWKADAGHPNQTMWSFMEHMKKAENKSSLELQTLLRDPNAKIRPGQRRNEIFKTATILAWRAILEKTLVDVDAKSPLAQETVLLFLESLSTSKELGHKMAEYFQEDHSKIPVRISPKVSSPPCPTPEHSPSRIPIRSPPATTRTTTQPQMPVTPSLTVVHRQISSSTPLGKPSRKRPRVLLQPRRVSEAQPSQPILEYGQTLCCLCHKREIFIICEPCRSDADT